MNVWSSPDKRKCDNVLAGSVNDLGHPVSRNGGMRWLVGETKETQIKTATMQLVHNKPGTNLSDLR